MRLRTPCSTDGSTLTTRSRVTPCSMVISRSSNSVAQVLVHLARDGDHETWRLTCASLHPWSSVAAGPERNATTRMCTLSTNTHAGKISSSQGTKPAPNSRLTAVA